LSNRGFNGFCSIHGGFPERKILKEFQNLYIQKSQFQSIIYLSS
jgi:hypothetical protein